MYLFFNPTFSNSDRSTLYAGKIITVDKMNIRKRKIFNYATLDKTRLRISLSFEILLCDGSAKITSNQ